MSDHEKDMERKHRQLAGCVPVSADYTRCLLITSRHFPNDFVFPKGGVKRGESAEEAAVRETWEECGAVGELGEEILLYEEHAGEEQFDDNEDMEDGDVNEQEDKRKRHRPRWFILKVNQVHDDYPEKGQRLCQWFFVKQARHLPNLRPTTRRLLKYVYRRFVKPG